MERIGFEALAALVAQALRRHGASAANAAVLGEVVAAAERDGARSHGLFRLAGYVSELGCGWVKGDAVPRWLRREGALLLLDGDNGYAQPAFRFGFEAFCARARELGLAGLGIRNAHHYAALWPEVEALAAQGFIALNFRGTRALMAPTGGRRAVLGTNPLAFACPRAEAPPIVFDMASSAMARGDMMLAARDGQSVPEGSGADAAGRPSTDPAAILQGGVQWPFGGVKGGLIALMVELLANAATGGLLALEDRSAGVKGAMSANGGQLILAIDPAATGGADFAARVEMLAAAVTENGEARLPGTRRLAARARATAEGIAPDPALLAQLRVLAGEAVAPEGGAG